MKHLTASDYYKKLFGCKSYKISIDAGCTCPTRDGSISTGGCIFCSAAGSGDFVPSAGLTVTRQMDEAKKLVSAKSKTSLKYIAYFQNFTNTYGNAEELNRKYLEAVSGKDVVGIAIGTRPDCISDEILKYISALCDRTFVQLELGFQTSNENSAEYFHRHYTNDVYLNAVKRIKAADSRIHIVTHVIFGLPDETKQDMLDTVRYVLAAGTDGIKITSLYVLKNTELEKDYLAGKFKALEMDEYFDLLKSALEIIPENVVIHRLTGDGPKKLLIAPLWTADKKRVLNSLKNLLTSF